MKLKGIIALAFAALLLSLANPSAMAVNDSSFITPNPHVDGSLDEICGNPSNNCNEFTDLKYIWLNGASIGHGLGEDGVYFFAVLEPGGQSDPNDGAEKNLSDDFDPYTNRLFEVSGGLISVYEGTHLLDSGVSETPYGDAKPNGLLPYIRLYPYTATSNPGSVYLLAVCSLGNGYPVNPSECKYESFKAAGTGSESSGGLHGSVFEDMYADGLNDSGDTGIKNQRIVLSGVGLDGKPIDARIRTDADGNWEFLPRDLSLPGKQSLVSADLTICAQLDSGWTQSFPGDDGCHHLTVSTLGIQSNSTYDFGRWRPVEVTACKERRNKGVKEPQLGWLVSLIQDGAVIDSQLTELHGCYTWTDLQPGSNYGVSLDASPDGQLLEPLAYEFSRAKSGDQLVHTFSTAPEGCTPGFWQSGNAGNQAGGKWLWNEPNDQDWLISGGQDWNPFIWTTAFNDFFNAVPELEGFDMLTLVGTGGGTYDYESAARDLVAAYLNAAWGMRYPYTTDMLTQMWANAVSSGDFMALHIELSAANDAHKVGGACPIDARNPGFKYQLYLPVILR